MSDNKIYNFDELDKFVKFTVNGHEYQFWYPTTKEAFELEKLGADTEKFNEFVMNHVKKPEGSEYPDFIKVFDELTVKQSSMFYEMITAELGGGRG